MTGEPRRAVLRAGVSPWAALWLCRRIDSSATDGGILESAARFERQGKPAIASELRDAYAQLQAAATQVKSAGALPIVGSAEVAGSETVAESARAGTPWKATLTVAEAADLLRVGRRRVVQCIHAGELVAAQRGRGCTWEIDRSSVMDLRDSKGSA